MAIVFIPTQLRPTTDNAAQLAVPGETLRDVLHVIAERHPRFVETVLREGQIAPGITVSIDGAMTNRGLLARVGPDSEIHFLPAFGAG